MPKKEVAVKIIKEEKQPKPIVVEEEDLDDQDDPDSEEYNKV